MRWRISIAVYAHSTGNGAEADKKAAGADEGDLYFYVDAQDFTEASKMAQCFSDGVKANPAVWEAPIMGVHRHEESRLFNSRNFAADPCVTKFNS